MGISFVREVRYWDDGVTEYQCLACKETWKAQTSPQRWRMCPVCGCHWTGMRAQKEKKYSDDPHRRTDRIRNLLSFRIESRFICYDSKGNPEEPVGEWKIDSGYHTFTTAGQAYRELKELRKKEREENEEEVRDAGHIYLGRYEYRVVPVRSKS